MTELWMAVGMAICDCDFNHELQHEVVEEEDMDQAVNNLLTILHNYGFRMSLYEIMDFLRIIKTSITPSGDEQNVMALMMEIHDVIWFNRDQSPECFFHHMNNALGHDIGPKGLKIANRNYVHPSVVREKDTNNPVIAPVHPMTDEPVDKTRFIRRS